MNVSSHVTVTSYLICNQANQTYQDDLRGSVHLAVRGLDPM